ncbi:MAG: hypothetical protein DIU62_008610 [Pseudomonadota bacterium]|jgi:hypothetical protein|nr:MAG: hypothetical protein DIU62_13120 [Pseudomonadota bacterium]
MNPVKGWAQGLIVLALAAGGVVHAAEDGAGGATTETLLSASGEPLQELDEILVHGKRLRDRIVEAENEFYKLYNQINKDNDYDMNCTLLNLSADTGSRLNQRVCLPVFAAEAIAEYTVFRAQCQPPMDGFDEFSCLDRNRDERLSRQEAAVRPSLDAQFMTLDADLNGYLTRDELPPEGTGGAQGYIPPPPELVIAERSKRWYDHMMAVIRSDPRLQEMAGRLDELHMEMTLTQRRVAEIEADRLANAPVRRPRVRPPR